VLSDSKGLDNIIIIAFLHVLKVINLLYYTCLIANQHLSLDIHIPQIHMSFKRNCVIC